MPLLVVFGTLTAPEELHAQKLGENFNAGWRFARGEQTSRVVEIGFDDRRWDQVRLPHDWAIRGPFDRARHRARAGSGEPRDLQCGRLRAEVSRFSGCGSGRAGWGIRTRGYNGRMLSTDDPGPSGSNPFGEDALFRRVGARTVDAVLPILCALFFALALLAPLRYDPPTWRYLLTVNLAASALFGLGYLVFRGRNLSLFHFNLVAVAGVVIIALDCAAVLWFTRNPIYSANFLLLLVGSGLLVVSGWMLLQLQIGVLATWLLVGVTSVGSENIGEFLMPMLLAVLVGALARRVRLQNLVEAEVAREREQAKREEVEAEVEARQAVEKDLAFAESILATVSNLVLVADRDGKIIYASPSVRTNLGFSESEVLGDGWFRLTRPDSRDAADQQRHVAEAAGSRVQASPYMTKIYDRESRAHWFLWQDTPGPGETLIGVGSDITAEKEIQDERDSLLSELQVALTQVRTLTGLLPICAGCKRIRDDAGYWRNVERFVEERSDVRFTHGLCPDCSKRLYPELYPGLESGSDTGEDSD